MHWLEYKVRSLYSFVSALCGKKGGLLLCTENMEATTVALHLSMMSGNILEMSIQRDVSLVGLKKEVSKFLRVLPGQIQLLAKGEVVGCHGFLQDLLEDKSSLELMAVVRNVCPKVQARSRSLLYALKGTYGLRVMNQHAQAIEHGEVDLMFDNVNLLEAAAGGASCASDLECIIPRLLEAGADINARSKTGNTPLLSACRRGRAGAAKLLLQHGADRTAKDPAGLSPLQCALAFFCAADKESHIQLPEELDLARFCLDLRRLEMEDARAEGLSETDSVRLLLSQAAVELSLLSRPGCKLTKKQALNQAQISLPEDALDSLQIWEGWPTAFLTFKPTISRKAAFDDDFVLCLCLIGKVAMSD